MFRFLYISSLSGELVFAHYFESIPHHLRASLEKDVIEECRNTSIREGKIHHSDCLVVFKREGLLVVSVGTLRSANENVALDLLNSFTNILVHHLNNKMIHFDYKSKTEKQTVTNMNILHEILGQMVRGDILETRISHINALQELQIRINDKN